MDLTILRTIIEVNGNGFIEGWKELEVIENWRSIVLCLGPSKIDQNLIKIRPDQVF